jgi:anti-sigma28 factor (negative regulator of flagellin synthesis)
MNVNSIPGEPVRTEAIQRSPVVPPAPASSDADRAEMTRGDAVHISDTARVLASSIAADETVPASIDPTRATELRARIFEGAYNSLEMAEQVARAILRAGDL